MTDSPPVPWVTNPPKGFDGPTSLPKNEKESRQWQQENRNWWENHPMRYDWVEELPHEEFSKEFYDEINHRFYETARVYMPWKERPFEELIDFDSLKDKDVLEIGVGNGSHAQLIAPHSRTFTGIDLTNYGTKSTSERMKVFNIDAKILRMDAEEMTFPDNSFDYIWSWGVIHCSSNTEKVLQQIQRVLRPGGKAIVMVYHRTLLTYYIRAGLFHGLFRGELFKTGSLSTVLQRNEDGALARFYTIREWCSLCSKYFDITDVKVHGSKQSLIPLPSGRLKNAMMRIIPDSFSRFVTNTCRQGKLLTTIMDCKN